MEIRVDRWLILRRTPRTPFAPHRSLSPETSMRKLVAPARALALASLVQACRGPAQRPEPPVVLFDGRGLDAFDTFVRGQSLNADTGHVFRVENGVIHVSGTEFGYLVTKRAFRHYRLHAEFRWG